MNWLYATVLSQFVQAVITVRYFKKKSPNVKIGRIRIDGPILRQVLAVGVSALLMQVLTLVQQTVIYRVAANYGGETSQILLGAALRFWNFSFVPLWGISQGFQPAAGTNYGAKDYDRVKFIPLCVLLPMIGGLGIRGVWLAIALTDAVLVVITIAMMASEFRKMPPTSQTLR